MHVGYLTLDDLNVVQNSSWDARAKWFNLGLQLNVKPSSLEAIQHKNKDHPDDCMTEMLILWLKQSNPRPSWSSLVAALKQQTVGQEDLADRIERQHEGPDVKRQKPNKNNGIQINSDWQKICKFFFIGIIVVFMLYLVLHSHVNILNACFVIIVTLIVVIVTKI